MADLLPAALVTLVDELSRLPGVGARTAERYAYYLLRQSNDQSERLSHAVANLHSQVKNCPVTFALISADQDVSPLYSDQSRDKTTVLVVEDPLDVIAVEKTGQYKGTYHVLGGAISPLDGVGPEQLHVPDLLKRIKEDSVQEVIIATNASVEGESTALYLREYLRDNGIDINLTRLARGIPIGVDLEYADQITLGHALEGRRELT